MVMIQSVTSNLFSLHTGCPNTPGKGSRFCPGHAGSVMNFRDDSAEMGGLLESKEVVKEKEAFIVKVLNDKETRQGQFYEVGMHFH